MNQVLLARLRAYQIRKEIETEKGKELYGRGLVDAIIEREGLDCLALKSDHPLLFGNQAWYHAQLKLVVVNRDVSDEMRVFYTAHELGHHFLHTRHANCDEDDINSSNAVLTLPYAEGRIATYHPKQIQEGEATVFACELLIPSNRVIGWFDAGQNAAGLVQTCQAPRYFVLSQMMTSLLGPSTDFDKLLQEGETPQFHWNELDDYQKKACCVSKGPALIQAGPGTGKTRTLIGRIQWLISERSVRPEKILVLTFSNKATEELRFRLRQTMPESAHYVTVSTFHGFGLELLRRYCHLINLPTDFYILDPVEAELLLEENLAALELVYFSNPAVPGEYLSDILDQIDRAKGELIDPEKYMQLVGKMENGHTGDDEKETIEKCREVGRVYQRYEELLRMKGVVDYGDLLIKPVRMLEDNRDELDQLRDQYDHVLIDEYQDINRANGKLIQMLAGEKGWGLWVVGDLRQSIYRWRGAAPSYIRDFGNSYPGANSLSLDINYRSSEQLVRFISHVATEMDLQLPIPEWQADKGSLEHSSVIVAQAASKETEWRGIADSIRQHVEKGSAYGDIAVLCRTNTQAREITKGLTALGIPTLHLGDFFFRREVKDLLAVLSLAVEGHGVTWPRVARLLRHPIQTEKAVELWKEAHGQAVPFPRAIREFNREKLNTAQLEELERLQQHLEQYAVRPKPSPWAILGDFLFELGDYLRKIRLGDDPAKYQMLLAIAQILNLASAFGQRAPIGIEENPTRAFIDYIRRSVRQREQDIDLPVNNAELDAVRILTIHKAKGLEFPIVFVPNLAERRFPPSGNRNSPVPIVEGLVSITESDSTVEEESCLFVAVSRAKEHLVLSYATSYHQQRGKPVSRARSRLWRVLDSAVANSEVITQNVAWNTPADILGTLQEWDESPLSNSDMEDALETRAIRVYRRCPRQYFYRYVLGIAVKDERDIYLQFHVLLYQATDWLRNMFSAGKLPDWDVVLARLDTSFSESIPREHVLASWYRQQAEARLSLLWTRLRNHTPIVGNLQSSISRLIDINGAQIKLQIDETLDDNGHVTVTKYRSGRPSSKDLEDPDLALARRVMQQTTDSPVEILLHYLDTDEVVEVPDNKDPKTLQELNQSVAEIRSGYFPPEPEGRYWLTCSNCSYLLLCPKDETM